MPASSVAIAIAPPSASISLTRCPLPIPPIDGLQDICPSVSMLCVSSSVARPCAPRERGLGAGMAAADDDDVEMLGELHGCGRLLNAHAHSTRTQAFRVVL